MHVTFPRCLLVAAVALLSTTLASGEMVDLFSLGEATIRTTAGSSLDRKSDDWRLSSDGDGKAELQFLPAKPWDLSKYARLRIVVKNVGLEPVTVRGRIGNPGVKGLQDACLGAATIMAGASGELVIRITRTPENPGYKVFEPFYMYYEQISVRDNTVDASKIAGLSVSIDRPTAEQAIEVSRIIVEGEGTVGPVSFFPFADEYGQYIHGDWNGKIYAAADFATRRAEEEKERHDWPGPKDWNSYGGWAEGPQLKATGNFYATKYEGKWWLVDPEGRLFWSYGPTGVGFGGDLTPVTDREHWFRDLPDRNGPMSKFYRKGRGATYRYYQERDWVGFDIAAVNLLRKYGNDYESEVSKIAHDRLRSWGFNTLGNWSSGKIAAMNRTPYVVAIHYGSPMLHYRLPDIYASEWEENLRERLERERDTTAKDPWNIGYFIDNERWFGWRPRAASIGEETLKNPAGTPAKIVFLDQLKAKYGTIEKLNESWGTDHASWDALAQHRRAPDLKKSRNAHDDCGDFGMKFSEKYFSTCKRLLKDVAPNHMYLGSRFHGHIDPAVVELAGKYCDVISYNVYDNPPDGRVNQYNKLDLPIMSTEWGIGSDPLQTPFRGKSSETPTPQERAAEMARYTEHAIRHPNMVGAHFFQYRDQPLTGRPDGEATLRGFVNIADTPNFELISANRRVAYNLYRTRLEGK